MVFLMTKKRDMTVGEIKALFEGFPDDMPVRVFLEDEVYANFNHTPIVYCEDGKVVHIAPGEVVNRDSR